MHAPGAKMAETINGVEIFRPRYIWPDRLEVLQNESGGLPVIWRQRPLSRAALLPFACVHSLAIVRYAGDCHLIHANWTLSAMCAWLGKPIHRKPVVVTVQGSDIYQAAHKPLINILTRLALNGSDHVVALSGSLRRATERVGVRAPLISVVPNGVDTRHFTAGTSERDHLILFVGSLIERKGVDILIASMARVIQRRPEYRLMIIGDGPMRARLGAMTAHLQMEGQVEFMGGMTSDDVRAWMQRARVFVLPSREEGLGVVLLEAIACGTPCIGSSVGGIPDIVTPDVGVLVPPADVAALTEAVLSILDDPVLWESMSLSARTRAARDFDWDIIAGRLIGIYDNVLRPHSE
jgi:glycosyltransferase involved in cell wall biosynthesis